MDQLRRVLIFALLPVAVFANSCKSRPAAPPVPHPPSASAGGTPLPPPPAPTESKAPHPGPTGAERKATAPQTPAATPTSRDIPRWIRIGLANDFRTVQITAKGRLLLENLLQANEPSNVAEGRVTLSLLTAQVEGNSAAQAAAAGSTRKGPIFRIQVASFRESGRADSLKRELESRFEVPVTITYNDSTGTYRVRVGECTSRLDAGELGERLQEAGYADGWIVSEEGIRVPAVAPPSGNQPAPLAIAPGTLEIQNERNSGMARISLPDPRVAPVVLVRISAQDPQDLLRFDNLSYRGTIELVENARGKLNVVNVLDLDDYLKGVVPNEMPPSKFDAIEALKAQAVAARTYALKNGERFRREGYQLCATIACQVYRGADSERPLSTEAVEATRGIVIEYQGELIDSLYTSTCGGHTEDAKNIFRTMDVPYLRSASCPPENAAEVDPRLKEVSGYHLKWTVHVTRADLEKTLRKTLPLDELVDLEPVEYGISSRVIELKVKGRKQNFTLKGLEVKSALGLKDSLFILDRERDRRGRIEAFVFIGRGWGHGVGLCQTGAYGLAREGQNFESILKTYYYNVDVVKENIREN